MGTFNDPCIITMCSDSLPLPSPGDRCTGQWQLCKAGAVSAEIKQQRGLRKEPQATLRDGKTMETPWKNGGKWWKIWGNTEKRSGKNMENRKKSKKIRERHEFFHDENLEFSFLKS